MEPATRSVAKLVRKPRERWSTPTYWHCKPAQRKVSRMPPSMRTSFLLSWTTRMQAFHPSRWSSSFRFGRIRRFSWGLLVSSSSLGLAGSFVVVYSLLVPFLGRAAAPSRFRYEGWKPVTRRSCRVVRGHVSPNEESSSGSVGTEQCFAACRFACWCERLPSCAHRPVHRSEASLWHFL